MGSEWGVGGRRGSQDDVEGYCWEVKSTNSFWAFVWAKVRGNDPDPLEKQRWMVQTPCLIDCFWIASSFILSTNIYWHLPGAGCYFSYTHGGYSMITLLLFISRSLRLGFRWLYSLQWVPPEADPEKRIWVQAVYLGSNSGKHQERTEEMIRGNHYRTC